MNRAGARRTRRGPRSSGRRSGPGRARAARARRRRRGRSPAGSASRGRRHRAARVSSRSHGAFSSRSVSSRYRFVWPSRACHTDTSTVRWPSGTAMTHGRPSAVCAGCDRRLLPVDAAVALFLPAVGRDALMEIALRIHEARPPRTAARDRTSPCSDRPRARRGRRRRSAATGAARTRRRSTRSGGAGPCPAAAPPGALAAARAVEPLDRRVVHAKEDRIVRRPPRGAPAARAAACAPGCARSRARGRNRAAETLRVPNCSRPTTGPWRARTGGRSVPGDEEDTWSRSCR